MAARILRPPRGLPPPEPPRPRATPGGTSATPPPPPAPIGQTRRRSAAALASPAGASELHFRVGARQAGEARPRLGRGGFGGSSARANPRAAGRGRARNRASCHPGCQTGKLRLAGVGPEGGVGLDSNRAASTPERGSE